MHQPAASPARGDEPADGVRVEGTIRRYCFTPAGKDRLLAELAGLAAPFEVEIRPPRQRASKGKRGLIEVWLNQVVEETGNDRQAVRREWRERFAPREVRIVLGQEKAVPLDVDAMTDDQAAAYLTTIQTFMLERFGIELKSARDE